MTLRPDTPIISLPEVPADASYALQGERHAGSASAALTRPTALIQFARRTHPEVLPSLSHEGGLRARVLRSGRIRVGDGIAPSESSSP